MTIKNGDLPAMPFTQEPYPVGAINGGCGPMATGLSKREQFAAMAMQGLLADEDKQYRTKNSLIFDAVFYADALPAEMERTKGEVK